MTYSSHWNRFGKPLLADLAAFWKLATASSSQPMMWANVIAYGFIRRVAAPLSR
jgi:hypothetical protein